MILGPKMPSFKNDINVVFLFCRIFAPRQPGEMTTERKVEMASISQFILYVLHVLLIIIIWVNQLKHINLKSILIKDNSISNDEIS